MSISVADKWTALFHNGLQLEDRVTSDIASDALLLIEALHDAWRRTQEQEGYELDPTVTAQAHMVLDALRARAEDKPLAVPWPIGTLQNWELKPPFHEAAGSLLKADWDTLKGLAMRKGVPVSDASGPACVWIIAAAEPLRKAWQRVCNVLLKGTRWQVHSVPTIDRLPTTAIGARAVIVLGSHWDAQSQAPLATQWRNRLKDDARVDLSEGQDVASAMAIITEKGPSPS